jgi:ABC-type uncharacterized transport system YnjBCD substrate-binding protein
MLSHKRHKTSAKSFYFHQQLTVFFIVAVALEAGFASNVVDFFKHISQVKRNAFSNKAFNTTEINTEVKVLGLAKTLMVFMKTNLH